jgi:hypothetical protein
MIEEYEILIIGSGPSAVAAAAMLIELGKKPCIVDAGAIPNRDAENLKTLRRNGETNTTQGGLARNQEKTWFNSAFSYEQHAESNVEYGKDVLVRGSFAKGGLSAVWGATSSMTWDYSSWPTSCIPSEADVAFVSNILNPSTTTNCCSEDCGNREIPGSVNSAQLQNAFTENDREDLFSVEASKLAISSQINESGCVVCGSCLNGCAWDAIWQTRPIIDSWLAQGKIDYLPGVYVEELNEYENKVEITVKSLRNTDTNLYAEKVIVAAGVIPTGAILLRSKIVGNIEIKDSSTAFGVMFNFGIKQNERKHHNLSQFWVRSRDKISFMAQIYPSSTEFIERIFSEFRTARLFSWFSRPLLHRANPIISYINDAHSGTLAMSVKKSKVVVSVNSKPNNEFHKGELKKIAKVFRKSSYLLPVFLTRFSNPGTGYHIGASMSHGTLTNELGVPVGCKNIHIVDASVLPNVCIGSITPTVMSNATRIARSIGKV